MAVRSPIFSLESMFPSKYRKQTEKVQGIFSLCNFLATHKYNIIMDLGVVTNILAEILKFYSYKNLDEVKEFKDVITSTEFLAKDIYQKIVVRLKKDYLDDYEKLHKIKIILTESNVAWASYEQEISQKS